MCRLAYELMNSKHTDASQRFRSLDDIYYFGGQVEHKVKAIWPHEAKSKRQFSFKVGDIIGIAGMLVLNVNFMQQVYSHSDRLLAANFVQILSRTVNSVIYLSIKKFCKNDYKIWGPSTVYIYIFFLLAAIVLKMAKWTFYFRKIIM